MPDKPRCDAVAAFHLTTGHDCLATHLHRLGISTEPFCPLYNSGEVMERNHLLRCGALQGLMEMSRYWEARALLGFLGGRLGLVGRCLLRGQRVPGPKPDSTKDLLCTEPVTFRTQLRGAKRPPAGVARRRGSHVKCLSRYLTAVQNCEVLLKLAHILLQNMMLIKPD
ncbi:hypothetical protein AVEN_201305-1 [Araneus ventricosus]|uniref:Uncharacterized protein n=1 Tax=Araneus ventricosus TaxID=182803 RepID=A0A4Y2H9M3_ARAVE|nr:hypothetical protein AVEN_201305-1 [Araneus ventricosus]